MQSGEDESLYYFRQARLGAQTVSTVNSPENQLLTIELEGSGSVQLSLSDSLIEGGVPNKKSAKYTISSPVYVDPGSLGYVPFYSGSQLLDSTTSIFYDSGSYYVGIGNTAWTTTPPAYPLDIQYDTNISGSLSVTGSTLITGSMGVYGDSFISGNLGVDGVVTAKELHITYVTSSVLYESGSTKFGNSFDDTHEITGSVMITGSFLIDGSGSGVIINSNTNISGSLTSTGSTGLTGSLSLIGPADLDSDVDISGSLTVTGSTKVGYISGSDAHFTSVETDYIDFTGVTPAHQQGRLYYNEDEHHLAYSTENNEVELHLGQHLAARVRNNSGGTINKGQVTIITGNGTQSTPYVTTASFDAEYSAASTLGVSMASMDDNNHGYVLLQGVLEGIDTSAYSAGEMLYLSSSGDITNVVPVTPNHEVRIGQVLRVNANSGSIFVRVQNGYEIEELHNVLVQNTSSGDLLVYNDSAGYWENTRQLTGSYGITGSLEVDGGLKVTGSTNIYLDQNIFETFKVDSSFADYLTINSSNSESTREIVIGRALGGGKDRYIKLTTNSFDFQNTPSSKISLSGTGITLFTNNRDQTFRIDDPNSPFVKYEWITKSSGSEGFEPLMQIYADSNYRYVLQPLKNASYEIKNSDTNNVYLNISSSSDVVSISGSSVRLTGSVAVATHLTASGHVSASAYYGDASGLTNLPSSGITALVDDPSPQLGGTLDVNGEAISGSLVQVTGSLRVSGSGTISDDILVGGSTKFGDSADDTHEFSGSIYSSGTQNLSIVSPNNNAIVFDGGNTTVRGQTARLVLRSSNDANLENSNFNVKSGGVWVESVGTPWNLISGKRWSFRANDTDGYYLYLGSSTPKMVVTGSSVGIGTATPEHELDVAGNAQVSGSLYLTGGYVIAPQATGLLAGNSQVTVATGSGISQVRLSSSAAELKLQNDKVSITGSTSISGPLQVYSDSFVSGNFAVDGTLTAKEFHTTFVTSSVLYESGSTKFGDSADDTHEFSGSANISGSLEVVDSFKIQRPGQPLNSAFFSIAKGHDTTFQSYGGGQKINLYQTSINVNRSLVAGTEGGYNHQITGSLSLTGSSGGNIKADYLKVELTSPTVPAFIGLSESPVPAETYSTIGLVTPSASVEVYGYDTAADSKVELSSSGYVRFNTSEVRITGSTGISGDLDVSGDITCTSLTETSARDLKDNVRNMNNELYKVLKLRPVSYDWKETKESDKGFIAEELNEVYPELTSVDDDGKSTGVKYTKMTSVLTRALQELHHIVETQQKEINKLKDELTILRDKDDG